MNHTATVQRIIRTATKRASRIDLGRDVLSYLPMIPIAALIIVGVILAAPGALLAWGGFELAHRLTKD